MSSTTITHYYLGEEDVQNTPMPPITTHLLKHREGDVMAGGVLPQQDITTTTVGPEEGTAKISKDTSKITTLPSMLYHMERDLWWQLADHRGSSSTEGVSGPQTSFPKRSFFGSVVFQGRLFVFGGIDEANNLLNDVWSVSLDDDGGVMTNPESTSSWKQHSYETIWSPRCSFGFAVVGSASESRLILVGGRNEDDALLNDAWMLKSAQSKKWLKLEISGRPWTPRMDFGLLPTSGYRLLLQGGRNSRDGILDDQWGLNLILKGNGAGSATYLESKYLGRSPFRKAGHSLFKLQDSQEQGALILAIGGYGSDVPIFATVVKDLEKEARGTSSADPHHPTNRKDQENLNWHAVTIDSLPDTTWAPRMHSAVNFVDEEIWISGGLTSEGYYDNSIIRFRAADLVLANFESGTGAGKPLVESLPSMVEADRIWRMSLADEGQHDIEDEEDIETASAEEESDGETDVHYDLWLNIESSVLRGICSGLSVALALAGLFVLLSKREQKMNNSSTNGIMLPPRSWIFMILGTSLLIVSLLSAEAFHEGGAGSSIREVFNSAGEIVSARMRSTLLTVQESVMKLSNKSASSNDDLLDATAPTDGQKEVLSGDEAIEQAMMKRRRSINRRTKPAGAGFHKANANLQKKVKEHKHARQVRTQLLVDQMEKVKLANAALEDGGAEVQTLRT